MNPRQTFTMDATNLVQSITGIEIIENSLKKRAETAFIQVSDYPLKCGFVNLTLANYTIPVNGFIRLESRDEIADFLFMNATLDEIAKLVITLSFED